MSLPKYIINFDELTDDLRNKLLELIDDELKSKYPELNTNNIQALLEDIKELLPSMAYEGIKNKIDSLILKNIEGIQKVEGELLDIPPIIQDSNKVFKFDKDVYLTGLHLNQTGWKKQDKYSLIINKNKIISNAATKEIGEHKYFNTFLKVNANTPISFILHNLSGNSRQVALDLEFIEGTESTEIIKPEVPSIEDIPNEWDVAVVMQWEENTPIDVDMHGFIDNMHVCFYQSEYPNFYLNFDYREHITNKNPEIISVKGYKNKKMDIYIHNYSAGELKENVNIKIYVKKIYGNKLIKEFNVKLENNNTYLKGVCTIDLKNLNITKLDKNLGVLVGGN